WHDCFLDDRRVFRRWTRSHIKRLLANVSDARSPAFAKCGPRLEALQELHAIIAQLMDNLSVHHRTRGLQRGRTDLAVLRCSDDLLKILGGARWPTIHSEVEHSEVNPIWQLSARYSVPVVPAINHRKLI